MKKPLYGVVAAAALGAWIGASALPAQDKTHTETTTKQTGPGTNTKSKTEWVTGTVTDYTPGKSIKISGPGDKSYSFDLDGNAHVKGSIVVGQPAKVGYSKSADGVERVSVISAASATSQAAVGASRAHIEQTTEHSAPGINPKTKSEVVIGTVKEYEAGKTIKVEGPGSKNYSFDLEHAAGVQGPIAVGERVRVTYTKTADGDKVTTVQLEKNRG